MLRALGFSLPIVTMSADGSGQEAARSRAAGATKHSSKPFVIEQLIRTVEELAGTSVRA